MMLFKKRDIQHINIELSDFCNMACTFCARSAQNYSSLRNKSKVFPKELYYKIVNYLPDLQGLQYVNLTGFNEFFSTPELTSFYLPLLKEKGLSYIILTNGSIYPNDIEYYILHPPKQVVVGFQTITEEQFQKCDRLKNRSFADYVGSVVKLVSFFYNNCPDTSIYIDVAFDPRKNNLNRLFVNCIEGPVPSRRQQLKNLGSFIRIFSQKSGIEIIPKAQGIQRYSGNEILGTSEDNRLSFSFKSFYDIKGLYDKIPCDTNPLCFSDNILMASDGDVMMCCIDYRHMTTFSNVNESPMDEIFDKYVELVNIMRTQGSPFECCRSCHGYYTRREKLLRTFLVPVYRRIFDGSTSVVRS